MMNRCINVCNVRQQPAAAYRDDAAAMRPDLCRSAKFDATLKPAIRSSGAERQP